MLARMLPPRKAARPLPALLLFPSAACAQAAAHGSAGVVRAGQGQGSGSGSGSGSRQGSSAVLVLPDGPPALDGHARLRAPAALRVDLLQQADQALLGHLPPPPAAPQRSSARATGKSRWRGAGPRHIAALRLGG